LIELEFLSPDRIASRDGRQPTARSPLEHALGSRGTNLGIEDISLSTGKIEVRGDVQEIAVDAEVVRITHRRALVLCPFERVAPVRDELAGAGDLVLDQTGALAGLRIDRPDAETLMRRLTALDLDALPAVGSVAHIQAHVLRDGPNAFRLFFAQEYGDYVGEVVVDAAEGLEGSGE
jgi:hypothetical protein